jgi:hypothetical protein
VKPKNQSLHCFGESVINSASNGQMFDQALTAARIRILFLEKVNGRHGLSAWRMVNIDCV